MTLTYKIRNWNIMNAIKRADFARDVLGDKVVAPLYIDWLGRAVIELAPRQERAGFVQFGGGPKIAMMSQSLAGRPPTLAQARAPGPFTPPLDLAFPHIHDGRDR